MRERWMLNREDPPVSGRTEVVNLTRTKADIIEAELVRSYQSAVGAIESDEIELHQSAAMHVQAATISASSSAFGAVGAENVELQNSAVGAVRGRNVSVGGAVGAAVSQSMEIGHARAGLLVAREVRADRIDSLIMISPRVEGTVNTMLDARGALIAGLVSGLVGGLLFLLGRAFLAREQAEPQ